MSPGAARVPRAPAAGAAPAQSGGTPSKATVEQFVAATSLEAVSMVGRAAMFLGNAVVDGIEGTAELVQNAAKKADKIAMNVARCVRRRDAPPFPSLFFFFRARSVTQNLAPVSRSISPLRAAPTAPLAATPPARAARTRGPISATRRRTRPRTRRPTGPGEASAVGCSRRSRTSPRVRDARAPAVPRRPPNAPPRTPRVRPRVKIPPRGRPGRGRARARLRLRRRLRRRRRRSRANRLTTAKIGVGERRPPRRTRGNSRRRFGRRWRTFVANWTRRTRPRRSFARRWRLFALSSPRRGRRRSR